MRFAISFLLLALASSQASLGQYLTTRGSVPLTPRTGVAVLGNLAHTVGANSFSIVSFSNPASPAVVGQVAPGVGTISGVAVRGDYAYCAGQTNGVVVIDVDNTSAPVWVRNVQAAAAIRHVSVSDTFLAAATGLNVTLFGLSSPSQPHLLTAYGRAANQVSVDAQAHKIHCAGSTGAFVLSWTVNQGVVTLTQSDEFGSNEYAHVSESDDYVNFAQGLQFSALHPNTYSLAGQYGASGQINGLASGAAFSVIGLSTAGVEYLRQTGNTPEMTSSVQATGGINALAVSPNEQWIIAATTAGVTVIENSPLAAHDPQPLPSQFELSAYPNPFNGVTTVTLSAPLRQDATLILYDMQGRELSRRLLRAQSTSAVPLDFSAYAAGSYIAQVVGTSAASAPLRLVYLP